MSDVQLQPGKGPDVHARKEKMPSIAKGIPKNLPSLSYANRLTRKASRLGFDWPDLGGALKKMDEELAEFHEALASRNRRRIGEELGDLLFVLVNVARILRVDPEKALKQTLEKFCTRFLYIETSLGRAGKTLQDSNLHEMDRLWNEAKRKRKNTKDR